MSHGRGVLSPDWRQWGLMERSLILAQEKEREWQEGSGLQGMKQSWKWPGWKSVVSGICRFLCLSLPLSSLLGRSQVKHFVVSRIAL